MVSGEVSTHRRGNPAIAVAVGLGVAVGAMVVAALPVVAMLLATPRGTPFPLSDPAMVGLFALAGAGIALLVGLADRRALRVTVAGVLLLLIAAWLSSGVWPVLGVLPTPPLLPTVPATLTLAAGVALGAALRGARASATSSPTLLGSLLLGVLAAAGVVIVTEAELWGRTVLQRTFMAPGGLSTPVWLAVVFVLVVASGVLLGVVLAARDRQAALLALMSMSVVVAGVALLTDVAGQPRTTRYGLALGLLAVALSRRPERA